MPAPDAIGVLVPVDPGSPPPPPEARPIGRAALALGRDGLRVVFGDAVDGGCISGLEAVPGGWRRAEAVPVLALHDRFPSQRRAARFAEIRAGAAGLPIGNPPSLTLLCRDKLACQQRLAAAGVDAQPAVEAEPGRFVERLAAWGAGFLKPRYGALGIGVRRVVPGDPLPTQLPGAVPGRTDPAILQRAVPPPAGWGGWSVRVVCQRAPGGGWVQGEPAVRRHRTDPVVNAARGASVAPGGDVLSAVTTDAVSALAARVTAALDTLPEGGWGVEVGVDLVIDRDGVPWLVEVNSRPRGRMEALAAADPGRFHDAHVAACGRPIAALAWMARRDWG
jgi:glutathione synthase/RimK-type ligase-like ATP-grasp enzyme